MSKWPKEIPLKTWLARAEMGTPGWLDLTVVDFEATFQALQAQPNYDTITLVLRPPRSKPK